MRPQNLDSRAGRRFRDALEHLTDVLLLALPRNISLGDNANEPVLPIDDVAGAGWVTVERNDVTCCARRADSSIRLWWYASVRRSSRDLSHHTKHKALQSALAIYRSLTSYAFKPNCVHTHS